MSTNPAAGSSKPGGSSGSGPAASAATPGQPRQPLPPGAPKPRRGPKQKGAGSIVKGKGEQKRDGLEIKEWQQTPKMILANWCKSNKRPNPVYHHAGGAKPGMYLMRVVLADPRGAKDRDVKVEPQQAFPSQVEAEHGVALLALKIVDGERQHESKLPEPYRSAWLALVGRKESAAAAAPAASSDPSFVCEICGKSFSKAFGLDTHTKQEHPKPKVQRGVVPAEGVSIAPPVVATPEPVAPPPPKKKTPPVASDALLNLAAHSEFASEQERRMAEQERERVAAAKRRATEERERQEEEANALVYMSEENRVVIENIVKAARGNQGTLVHAENAHKMHVSNPIVQGLMAMGFNLTDAKSAAAHAESEAEDQNKTLATALDWLCVHLPEERLPPGLDPRKSHLELVKPTTATTFTSAELHVAEGTKMTLPPPMTGSDEEELLEWYGANVDTSVLEIPADAAPTQAQLDSLNEEHESLVAILGEQDVSPLTRTPGSRFARGKFTLELGMIGEPNALLKSATIMYTLDLRYPSDGSAPLVLVRGGRDGHDEAARAVGIARAMRARALELGPDESVGYVLWELARTATLQDIQALSSSPLLSLPGRDAENGKDEDAAKSRNGGRRRDGRNHHHNHRLPSAQELQSYMNALHDKYHKDTKFIQQRADMQRRRATLPAHSHKQQILQAVAKSPVVLVKGETGSGKTTQVPQYVLEQAIETKQHVNIVCTQPRRLAATSVAMRVAQEMTCEVGKLVGYRVQLDSRAGPDTRLEFVTTGLLLRRLEGDPLLKGTTHVFVDEVHERSVDSDFLLALLRNMIQTTRKDLKIVLMSATMDHTAFVKYFALPKAYARVEDEANLEDWEKDLVVKAPILEIPGRTFPVDIRYLDRAFRDAEFAPKGMSVAEHSLEHRLKTYEERDLAMDPDLVGAVVRQAARELDVVEKNDTFKGAILVFCSGVAEISKASRAIEAALAGNCAVLPLHGALSTSDQKRVFDRVAAGGKRKIIVSTNVAETSVTVEDVVVVVDTGRHKEVRYNPEARMSSLIDTWVSHANAKQRAGRAGRVRPGVAIRLWRESKKLDSHQAPEVHRVPLEQCALQVAAMNIESIGTFLSKLVEPPGENAVRSAVEGLLEIGAIERHPSGVEKLTPLGTHLARLPLDARLGKMLIYSCVLGCARDTIVIAAGLSRRSPFLNPGPDQRAEAEEARRKLMEHPVAAGSQSDHALLLAAFESWESSGTSDRDRREFAKEHMLAHEGLREMSLLRNEYRDALESAGFYVGSLRGAGSKKAEPEEEERAVRRRQLFKAALCAGLYPRLIRVKKPPPRYVETAGGAVELDPASKELKFYDEACTPPARVFVHPGSVNFTQRAFNSPWLVYGEKFATTKDFVRDTTCVAPYGILLFGGSKLVVQHAEGLICVDDTAKFRCPARVGVLIKEIRSLLGDLLKAKIENPDLDVESSKVVEAVKRLIQGNGWS